MQFVVSHGHPVGRSRSRQSHQVLRSNIRRKNRSTHDPPAQVTSGEEVIFGGVFAPENSPPRDPKQNQEVEPNHGPVQSGKGRTRWDRGEPRSKGVHEVGSSSGA